VDYARQQLVIGCFGKLSIPVSNPYAIYREAKLLSKLKKSPMVSVLLSVYNSDRYVGSAIESILNQSFNDFDFIIVDDSSKDSSWNIIEFFAKKDPRILAIKNIINIGGCRTLNRGLEFCTGKYIARLDNDDWSYPDRLKKQVDYMEAHPEVGILGGSIETINEFGNVVGKRTYKLLDQEIRKGIFFYSPFAHPAVMIRKSILDEVGSYNAEFAPADDYELYFRIGKKSKFANLSDTLLRYRIIPNSMTFSFTKKMEQATIKVRNLYSKDQGYEFTLKHSIYNIAHYLSIFIVPSKLKIMIFNFFRNER
jgi:glycosyltransferase involved in cell wall biosynthesis